MLDKTLDKTSDKYRNDFGGFTLSDLRGSADPYPLLEQARSIGGAVGKAGNPWLVLGHEAATAVLRSPHGRSGFVSDMYREKIPAGAAQDEMANRINFLDPPHHPRVRRIVAGTFTPKRIGGLRPYIEQACHQALDEIANSEGPVDLIANFAYQIPSLAISELLGVPDEDRSKMTQWSEQVANLLGLKPDSDLAPELQAAEEMHAYLRALAAERRLAPKDDLLSALLVAEDEGDTLSEAELLSLAATLYSAGNRTTRDMLSNGLSVLLQDAATKASFQAGEIPEAILIKEFLRYETPTFYVMRMLSEDLEVGGKTIPANEPVAVVLAAANRDPAVFKDADEFKPSRWLEKPAPMAVMSFANGAHFCLGANLARLESQIMLETLFKRFPNISLAAESLNWRHTGLFRSLETLSVNLH